jgi:hypothetical protein
MTSRGGKDTIKIQVPASPTRYSGHEESVVCYGKDRALAVREKLFEHFSTLKVHLGRPLVASVSVKGRRQRSLIKTLLHVNLTLGDGNCVMRAQIPVESRDIDSFGRQ